MTSNAEKVKALFLSAIEKYAPEQWPVYLDGVCGDDAEMRGRMDYLLKAHRDLGSIQFDLPPEVAATIDQPATSRPGTVIGPYTLREQIGEGGMGVVYVAEQSHPVRRKVALKVIKPGMDTKQVVARFEAERQALAMMDHPNIAKVHDGGTTESGRPYFVMELVPGVPITEFCDGERLSVRQRLELFVLVCRAVQHAHQKGIIHRDLKPSNILVTLHDGVPVPKVIDFGVAKAMGQSLTDKTVYTALSQLVGTPLYMSPEQAEMNQLGVDTRSDVYSLGVLLYELLTGTTPFDKEALGGSGLEEMRRMIREDEPPCPSARVSSLQPEAVSTTSQRRSTDPRRISAALHGELDWIVMKSLEKDRGRRYESAGAFATDVQRYLDDEPVLAGRPSTMYKFHKFARKHKAALSTAVAIAASLILGTTASAWQAVRATTAEAQANANATQAQASAQDAREKAQEATTQRDEAQRQRDEVKALDDKLRDTQAQLRSMLYAAHMNLAQHAWDEANVQRVLELLDQHRPKQGEPDLRGFEWHYFQRLCNSSQLFKVTVPLRSGGATIPLRSGGATFSPDGKRLFALGRGGWTRGKPGGEVTRYEPVLEAYDAQTGQELLTLTLKGGGQGQSGILSPDGKRVAVATLEPDNTLRLWDVETGKEVLSVTGSGGRGCLVFSPDGKRLASAPGKEVKVWDAHTGQQLSTLKGHTEGVVNMAFSGDSKRLVSVGSKWDGEERKYVGCEVKVWDVQTGKELFTINESADAAFSASFSSDGKRLLTHSEEAKVWDAQTGKELFSLEAQGIGFRFVAFSPDGERIVTAEAGAKWPRITVWDAQTGQVIFILQGHASSIYMLAFSPDGKRLASRERERKVLVWDLQTGREVATLRGVGNPSVWASLAFSPDGKRLAIDHGNSLERGLKIWDWEMDKNQASFTLSGIKFGGSLPLGAPYVAFTGG